VRTIVLPAVILSRFLGDIRLDTVRNPHLPNRTVSRSYSRQYQFAGVADAFTGETVTAPTGGSASALASGAAPTPGGGTGNWEKTYFVSRKTKCMPSGNELALYGFLSLVAILFVLVTGPLGLIAVPFALIIAGLVRMSTDSDSASPGPVNCAGCGAPNEPGSDACSHCGEAL
jgi:hypothetical protein